jgi:hypothetical protein
VEGLHVVGDLHKKYKYHFYVNFYVVYHVHVMIFIGNACVLYMYVLLLILQGSFCSRMFMYV